MTTLQALPESTGLTMLGISAVLTNTAQRRREWCAVAVPADRVLGHASDRIVFVTSRGLRLRAFRCEEIANHSVIYRVFAPFDNGQSISGEFAVLDAPRAPDVFKLHPWCGDNPQKLIPMLELRLRNPAGQIVSYRTGERFDALDIEAQNDCMLRFHFRTKLGASGFIAEGWFTFYDNSPIVDVRVAPVWSDMTTPIMDLQVEGLFFLSGEPVVFDFAKKTGMTEIPVWNGQHWITLVCAGLSFRDGSGLALFGRMMCFPDREGSLPSYDPETYNDQDSGAQIAQDVETLRAAANGPVLGIASRDAWNGRMLAHRNTPRIGRPQEHVEAMADSSMARAMESLRVPGHVYDARPGVIGQNPGQTGDQADFGSAKGWEAVCAADARWLLHAMYAVSSDFFRGVLHYETDGTRLDPARHPSWVSWSGYTHFNGGVSPDRKGKDTSGWGTGQSTGWLGYDDEHRSQTMLATLYALTGDPLLKFLIEHYSTTDIANVRHKLEFGTGAPRAVGRTVHCWANFMTLFPASSTTHQRFRALIDRMASLTERDWLGDRLPGPVDILSDRTDPRMGVTHNGVALAAWSCWEHGLFVVGAYAAWKVTRDARWLRIVRRVCRTIVRYACFRDAEGWTFLAACHWPRPGEGPTGVAEGEPLPAQWYVRTSKLIVPEVGGVSTWTQNAVLIFIEAHEANDPDMARAQEIAATFMPGDPEDPRTAEWQACVRSNPVVPGDWRNY